MSVALFRDDAYLRTCSATVLAAEGAQVTLDRTVFYPAGGGQPGDTGWLTTADGTRLAVIDTRKGTAADEIVHILAPDSPLPDVGTSVEAELDWTRRFRHMRMHTALHLLCAVVPAGVTGGQIGADKSRLDFAIAAGDLDKVEIEAKLNALVAGDHAVSFSWISDAELAAQPQLVRTMSVMPPMGSGSVRLVRIGDVDLQPCGGTHVNSTAEIGTLQLIKIENKGKQNRRIQIALAD
jgi:misacylated tRNA(Ala) deacylase